MKKNYNKKSSPCHCINIRRASTSITSFYDEKLKSCGLTVNQFSLLRYLKFYGGLSVSDLALEMRLDRSTLVRTLKPLEEKGLVADTSEKGTRNRELTLTNKGTDLLSKAEPLWMETQKFITQYIGEDEMNLLKKVLSKMENLAP